MEFSRMNIKNLALASLLVTTVTHARVIDLANVAHDQRHAQSVFNDITAQEHVVGLFYAPWCPPCQRMHPIVNGLANKYPQVTFLKVNIEKYTNLKSRFRVNLFPTLMFFSNNRALARNNGSLKAHELSNKINRTF